MISTLKKLQDKKAAQEIDGGFTLIELLIVIVVLGILAAVVVFSLGGVTSKSAISACQADGATVNTAIAAFNAQEGAYPATTTDLLGSASGGPYLQSWPSNSTHYKFDLESGGKLYEGLPTATAPAPGTGWTLWAGASTCNSTTVK